MVVKMKPGCDCGYIFKELSIVAVDVDVDSCIHVDCRSPLRTSIEVSPYNCPMCNEQIEGVSYHYPINGRFEYDEKKYTHNKIGGNLY